MSHIGTNQLRDLCAPRRLGLRLDLESTKSYQREENQGPYGCPEKYELPFDPIVSFVAVRLKSYAILVNFVVYKLFRILMIKKRLQGDGNNALPLSQHACTAHIGWICIIRAMRSKVEDNVHTTKFRLQ